MVSTVLESERHLGEGPSYRSHWEELWPVWESAALAQIYTNLRHPSTSDSSSVAFGYWSPLSHQPASPTQAPLLLEAFPGCLPSTSTPPQSP